MTNYKTDPLKDFDLQTLDDIAIVELLKFGPVDAYSRWINNEGIIDWRLCLIKSFDIATQLFNIQWKHNNKEKKVTRLNLMLKTENPALFDRRREEATNMRYRSLYLESYKKS